MKLSEDQVRYVADLANLSLSEDEVAHFSTELSAILDYVEKLNELDTADVAPMAHVLFDVEDQPTATMRTDVPGQTLTNEDALANAPLSGNGYFKVPLVIEK